MYSPNSVIEAVDNREFGNYWSKTETYESLKTYIAMDFHGLKQLIVDMRGGSGCTGSGFADMVFLPKRSSLNPALILELKWDKTARGAISQIKNKKYVSALKEYKGNILLVGISYEKKSKKHHCRIEKYEI